MPSTVSRKLSHGAERQPATVRIVTPSVRSGLLLSSIRL
jgi:hypothetical protein